VCCPLNQGSEEVWGGSEREGVWLPVSVEGDEEEIRVCMVGEGSECVSWVGGRQREGCGVGVFEAGCVVGSWLE